MSPAMFMPISWYVSCMFAFFTLCYESSQRTNLYCIKGLLNYQEFNYEDLGGRLKQLGGELGILKLMSILPSLF